jgi:hypothetical protein
MGTGDSLIVNPTAVIVPSLFGTNNDLRVSANVNWTADIAPNPWLTFNAGPTPLHMNGSPVFDFPVTLYFDTNTASTARGPVQITFTSNGGGTPVVKFVDVTQSGVIVPFDTLTVNRTDLTVGSSSGSDNTTTVTSNVSWMADMASNSWLSFSNGSTNLHITGGVGTNPVTLYYLSNNSIFNRGPVRITFTSTGTGTPVVKYLDVTQSGFSIFPDTLTLNKSTLIVPTAPLGSDSTVSVTSNTTWVADIPNNTTWFAFDSALSLFHITGSGSTPVTIYYDANTSTADRVPVTVTFTSTGNGTPVVRNLEVKQCGTGGCAGGLRPKYSPF